VGLERGSLSLVRIIEELLEWKSSGSGLEKIVLYTVQTVSEPTKSHMKWIPGKYPPG
jgi:hypothetical protein